MGNQIGQYSSDAGTAVSLEPGDICIAASYQEGEVDIRRNSGTGRVLVLDSELNPKGALWTGEEGLVLGLAYAPDTATLYVSDASSQTVKRFSASGEALPPFPAMQGKPFGPISVADDGTVVIGEHIRGDKFPFIGGGAIYRFDAAGKQIGCYSADHDPGKFGFHGVTNMALCEDDRVALYISETGHRMMRYDLAADTQMEDLFVLPAEGERVTAGFSLLEDGTILLGHVYGVSLLSATGDILKDYDIARERGWAAVKATADGRSFLAANFFTGRLEKRDIKTGDILAVLETDMPYKLASIVEITDATGAL